MIDYSQTVVKKLGKVILLSIVLVFFSAAGNASNHYTDRQMDALATRVGKTFWLNSRAGKLPMFLSAPSARAAGVSFRTDESFVITELAGRAEKNPYYVVMFESGKVAYIGPEAFHEALNLTIVSADPRAKEKEVADQRERDEKERVEWIQAQPWSPVVKQAAINRQPTPGLNTGEVKRVLGEPQRVTNFRGPVLVAEEHWFYPDGSVLIFHNGLLSKIDKVEKR
jgi:hypothetical protein